MWKEEPTTSRPEAAKTSLPTAASKQNKARQSQRTFTNKPRLNFKQNQQIRKVVTLNYKNWKKYQMKEEKNNRLKKIPWKIVKKEKKHKQQILHSSLIKRINSREMSKKF